MTKIDRVTLGIYLGDLGVHSLHRILYLISSQAILSFNELQTLSFASFNLTGSFRDLVWIRPIAWILAASLNHTFSPSTYAPRARTALAHEYLLDAARGAPECRHWALCLLAPLCHHTREKQARKINWSSVI